MPKEFVPSVCPHDCPSTCALEVERLNDKTIGRIRGSSSNPYTDGVICAKVARYAERVHNPNRLSHPLRRTGPKGSGRFETVSWELALDTVAEAFADRARRFGPETVWPYLYCGTMGHVQRDGIERLRRAMGYSGMDRTICSIIARTGWDAGAGADHGVSAMEMADSKLIIMWGVNAASTQVNAMRHAIKARKSGNAQIIVVDPYRNKTAMSADKHLAIRPGTDGALACAVMHVLFAEGYADRDYMARFTDCPDDLEAHLESRTPAWAAAITGLDEDEITEFARTYGSTRKSFIRLGYGFTRSRNGAANMHAVSCLPAVTGAWKERGGGALFSNYGIYNLDKTIISGLDLKEPSRNLDMNMIGAVLCGDKKVIGDGPPVTAMLIQNTNPLVVCPETSRVRKGFHRDDLFVCVHEQVMTETALIADIVLPATTFLEHDDIYLGGGHTFLQVARKVIEPFAESRSNHQVISGLAKRLGARHPGFSMTAWELVEATLKASGYPGGDEIYKSGGLDCALDFDDAHFLNGFATSSGRFHFAPDWKSMGPYHAAMPKLPDHMNVIDNADDAHPFRLVTAPTHNFLNTTFSETVTSQVKENRPTVMIHPADCLELGIVDGDKVRLGNRRGSVVVHARHFDGLQKGVVVAESPWPNEAYVDGMGINALTGSDPVPPAGGAAFHDTAVWIKSCK